MQCIADFCGNHHISFSWVSNSDRHVFRDERVVWPEIGEFASRDVTGSCSCSVIGSPEDGTKRCGSRERLRDGDMRDPQSHGPDSTERRE